jgi:hypothetical protein
MLRTGHVCRMQGSATERRFSSIVGAPVRPCGQGFALRREKARKVDLWRLNWSVAPANPNPL